MLEAAAQLDFRILALFNEFYGHTPRLNALVLELAENDFVKSGPLLAILLWFWYQRAPEQAQRKQLIVGGILGSLAAAASSRALCIILPYRARPVISPGLMLEYPWPPRPYFEGREGSFPSDHAALAFGLVTAVFLLSRGLGALAAVYAVTFTLLPRIYLGYHWPGDIVAGCVVGIVVCAIVAHPRVRGVIARPLEELEKLAPGVLNVAVFFLAWGVLTRFDNVRNLAHALQEAMH